MQSPVTPRPSFRQALAERVLVADGAMGTMLQEADLSLDDFQGLEGCNEILNVTRPDVVRAIHDAYFEVGVDAVETNSFGSNLPNLAEYGIEHRIYELSEASARIAREAAEAWSTPDQPRFVIGSVGPGTRLPTLGHAPYATLRDAYREEVAGLIAGGADAILVETAQDPLQARAALAGARFALDAAGSDLPLYAQITVETTGSMLLGTETGAALTALEPLGIDGIGLNCATGPAEMTEHLRTLSRQSLVPVSCMPNAGLPELSGDGAKYPLTPTQLATALSGFITEYGLRLVGGCCGTTPEHLRAVVEAVRGLQPAERQPVHEPSAASLYAPVTFRQDSSVLAIGERANANGSRAFRDALVQGDYDQCVEIARSQVRDGAHMLDLCVDYVGRDGVADMAELASRLATASTLPLVLDSTEPPVLQAGLERLGGRAVVNSVNYEDGDGPDSRFARIMPLVREHGAAVVALTIDETGQARTADHKVEVATRLIEDLTNNWNMRVSDILVDTLTFPIATGQEETRRDAIETIAAIRALKAAYPEVHTVLGVSNVSFGLNPAARQVLNSVFLDEAVKAGLDAAIIHPSKILPIARIDEEYYKVALDLVHDRREYDAAGNTTYDPLGRFLDLFADIQAQSGGRSREEELAEMPLVERIGRRIVEAERQGLIVDLEEALTTTAALSIVNDVLLPAMREVGELFASGQMQLPFVLASAETMKAAVAHLEPHMESSGESGKGSIVLATVKGDVHDIGKNLVDIILTNNGYNVVNIGIKQPMQAILDAAESNQVDAIGMSGLLVKSTLVMRDNLDELNKRGVANKYPVLLGGAALTRAFVEEDLAGMYEGEVRYAKDAFEGLALMDAVMAVKRGVPGATLPALRGRRVALKEKVVDPNVVVDTVTRSNIALDNPIPKAPFWGERIVKGIPLGDYLPYLDERALFLGQWGLKASRGDGPGYDELVETEGRPRLRALLDSAQRDGVLEAAVVYGYFPAVAEGNDVVILDHDGANAGGERCRFTFPRQTRDRRLCLADFVRPRESGEVDVVGFHVVTMGSRISEAAAKLFEANAYRDYLELHGLGVQLTEALAEAWHARIRKELGIDGADSPEMKRILKQDYQGERYSFGYPACPDLTAQTELAALLRPERIGVTVSEEFQLHPEQSTSAIIFHHPEATYFNAT